MNPTLFFTGLSDSIRFFLLCDLLYDGVCSRGRKDSRKGQHPGDRHPGNCHRKCGFSPHPPTPEHTFLTTLSLFP